MSNYRKNGGENIYSALKTKKVMTSMLFVGVISFPIFYFVKEWLLKQKKIINEERRRVIKEIRMKQQEEYDEMLRRESEKSSS